MQLAAGGLKYTTLSTVSFFQPLKFDLDAAMPFTDIGRLKLLFWILFRHWSRSTSIPCNEITTSVTAHKPVLLTRYLNHMQ